ncbi:MAG TPA: hypothetical protein VFT31_10605 [Kribbella sp.]|nr:hypothetical protein [Kribbella sp.]
MEPTTTEILTDALKRAAAAHGVYEEEVLGKHDDEWPRWYAEHMTRTLAEDGYQLVPATPGTSHDE